MGQLSEHAVGKSHSVNSQFCQIILGLMVQIIEFMQINLRLDNINKSINLFFQE